MFFLDLFLASGDRLDKRSRLEHLTPRPDGSTIVAMIPDTAELGAQPE